VVVRRGVVISVLYITYYFGVKLIILYSACCSLLDKNYFRILLCFTDEVARVTVGTKYYYDTSIRVNH